MWFASNLADQEGYRTSLWWRALKHLWRECFALLFVSNEPHAPNCRLIGHVFLSDLLNRHV